MNAAVQQSSDLSARARERFLLRGAKPLFLGNWERVLFVHYETDREILQKQVPFELDLWQGAALLSVVAFSMRRLRPAFGGRLAGALLWPIASHEFFNVRAYVRHEGRPGIYFVAEWVNNPLSVLLGPATYGLPYRYGRIGYEHRHEQGRLTGRVAGGIEYAGQFPAKTIFQACPPGSRDEFLLERYSAFTRRGRINRMFDIWHEPWAQCPVELRMKDELLRETGLWFDRARRVGANYSPGVEEIWMGAPRRI